MLKLIKSAICAAIMIGGATAASAQDLPQDLVESLMNQCRPDYHRLCPDVVPGGGRVGRCLYDQQERLAPGCLKAVKLAYAVKVCLPDYRRYCNGLPPGDERIISCLAQNYGGLLPECERIVRANEPYVDRSQPRYSDYGDRNRFGNNRPYDNGSYGDKNQHNGGYNKSYDDKNQYNGGYNRSYQDSYDGNQRFLGRSHYSSDQERAEANRNNGAYINEDDDREPIK